MITLLEVLVFGRALHKQQSQEIWKGISSIVSERGGIWGQTKGLLEWISHSHQDPLGMPASFLLPHKPEAFHYLTVPGTFIATHEGTALPIGFVGTVGVNGENPSHLNHTLCDQGHVHLQVYPPSAALPDWGHCALCPPMSPMLSQMCHREAQGEDRS